MKKIKTPKEYMLYLLARREYSQQELKEKALKKFPDEFSDVENLIQFFVQKNWLSDIRFVEVFIRDQKLKNIGPLKIVEKLWIKGISTNFAQEHLESFYTRAEQEIIIKKLIEKKYKLLKSKNLRKSEKKSEFEIQQKVLQYILLRGFDISIARELLDK